MKLTAEQFADLTASFRPQPADSSRQERRRASRLELAARVGIRIVTDGVPSESTMVPIHDFSSRGIAILHDASLPAGSQFVVELQRQSGGSVSMLCTVTNSRPLQQQHKIGAEFTCVLAEQGAGQASSDAADAELKRIRESVLD